MYGGAPQGNSSQKFTVLNSILNCCAYTRPDAVRESCIKLFQIYPNLDAYQTSFFDGTYSRNLVEVRGNIAVNYVGRSYNVVMHVSFPWKFPEIGPAFKLKNIDVNRFKVNPKYAGGSLADGLVQLYLPEMDKWPTNKDIITIMKAIELQLGKDFPFYEPQGGIRQPEIIQEPINIMKPNPDPKPVDSKNPNPLMLPAHVVQILNQKIQNDVAQLSKPLLLDLTNQLKTADAILAYKDELDDKESDLKIMERNIINDCSKMDREIASLQRFIDDNDKLVLRPDTLDNFVKENDPFSEQMVNLVSENRALADSLSFIEHCFKKDKIDFETMQKLIRQYAIREFENKTLLKKCMSVANNI